MSRFRRRNREMPEMNTSSLPDLVFAFLFFIMMVTKSRSDSPKIEVMLPISQTSERLNTMSKADVFVGYQKGKHTDSKLSISFGEKIFGMDEAFEPVLAAYIKEKNVQPISEVKLHIDKDCPMKDVAALEAILKKNGVKHIIYISDASSQLKPKSEHHKS